MATIFTRFIPDIRDYFLPVQDGSIQEKETLEEKDNVWSEKSKLLHDTPFEFYYFELTMYINKINI